MMLFSFLVNDSNLPWTRFCLLSKGCIQMGVLPSSQLQCIEYECKMDGIDKLSWIKIVGLELNI